MANRKPKVIEDDDEAIAEEEQKEEREELASAELEPSSDQIDDWYTIQEAAEIINKSHHWIRKLIRQGRIHPRKDSKGTVRIEPAEIEKFAMAGNMAVENQADVIKILSEAASAHLLANQKLVSLLPDAVSKILNQQNQLLDQCFKRIGTLESERTTMLEAVESANSQREAREAEKFIIEQGEKRKDTALGILSEHGPKLVEQLLMGSDVSKLIGSLEPALLQALTEEGSPLDAEQKTHVLSIVKRLEAKKSLALVKKEPVGKGEAP